MQTSNLWLYTIIEFGRVKILVCSLFKLKTARKIYKIAFNDWEIVAFNAILEYENENFWLSYKILTIYLNNCVSLGDFWPF